MKNKLKGHTLDIQEEVVGTEMSQVCLVSLPVSLCLREASSPWRAVVGPCLGISAGRGPSLTCTLRGPTFPVLQLSSSNPLVYGLGHRCSHCMVLGKSNPLYKNGGYHPLGGALVTTRYQVPGINFSCHTSHL